MHINTLIIHVNKHTIKIYNQYMYTIIIIKIFYFFSLIYKNERKKNLDDKVTFTKKKQKNI